MVDLADGVWSEDTWKMLPGRPCKQGCDTSIRILAWSLQCCEPLKWSHQGSWSGGYT